MGKLSKFAFLQNAVRLVFRYGERFILSVSELTFLTSTSLRSILEKTNLMKWKVRRRN